MTTQQTGQARDPSFDGRNDTRVIAFCLPQYHAIPENDEWWGKGFTEWTNVVKARPIFKGHYQPHLPADLGFYDLRLSEAREAQAELAKQYGIHGFCYYHYWFNGRRVLERPFAEVLASGKPQLPFCLCWANEPWNRRWDGCDHEVLLGQVHTAEDDAEHITSLIPALMDDRYIRIGGGPLLLIYRTDLLPHPERTAEIWREIAARHGIDLYLCRVESAVGDIDPASIGFDAAIEFAPDRRVFYGVPFTGARSLISRLPRGKTKAARILTASGLVDGRMLTNSFYEYEAVMNAMLARPQPEYKRFSCACPSWDNSPRRAKDAIVLLNSTPELYEQWLATLLSRLDGAPPEERVVFVNTWNEWGEGCHLEPDSRDGRAYLEATRRAIRLA